MQFDSSGKHHIVTGASSGIGEVTARLLRAAGAEVIAIGQNAALAQDTGCQPLQLDIADSAPMAERAWSDPAKSGPMLAPVRRFRRERLP